MKKKRAMGQDEGAGQSGMAFRTPLFSPGGLCTGEV